MFKLNRMTSYAQNQEDVLLRRVFPDQSKGFYIDVGAADPIQNSVTKHFYERGWHGINVEPHPVFYKALCADRTNDINLNIAVSNVSGEMELYCRGPYFELSSLNPTDVAQLQLDSDEIKVELVKVDTLRELCKKYANCEINFLKVDVEGSEKNVLEGADWNHFRPQVVLIEATRPNSQIPTFQEWEHFLLANNYLFVYFDGLNRFYLRGEDSKLADLFKIPVNIFDNYELHATRKIYDEYCEAQGKFHKEYIRVSGTFQDTLIELETKNKSMVALYKTIQDLEGKIKALQNSNVHGSNILITLRSKLLNKLKGFKYGNS